MTAQGKVTTANATPGTRILADKREDGTLRVAHRKTGAVVATVQDVSAEMIHHGRRMARRYSLHTDQGVLADLAPSQTHYLAK